jgi:hypothetical protein
MEKKMNNNSKDLADILRDIAILVENDKGSYLINEAWKLATVYLSYNYPKAAARGLLKYHWELVQQYNVILREGKDE